ncbi:MAG TPA: N-acetylmuramoyl-L-alanine amidase [Gaiellaceae bacterium]|nr:N-acetylmuramoyl-L-alanine amidase [Gaiellaceae bacterium]
MPKLIAAVLAVSALVLPAAARAGDVTMHVEDVPLGARMLASAPHPVHFDMLGLHWQGLGRVSYRVHRLHGRWGAWTQAGADGDRTGRWHDGGLDWTGAADAVRFRFAGRVTRLRAYEVWSRVTVAAPRSLATASQPAIVSRAAWGANEEIVRAKPLYAPAIRLAIVHHTAGTNAYTPAQAAAIVRGIEIYHVEGNGWNDIGYNFLVDRFGTIYEGRGGGITRNVIGAHAAGFNAGTVGVALIGNFTAAAPPRAMQDALVKLLAWRLDLAHVDPLSTVAYVSGGNFKYRAGRTVVLRSISGHRDTGPTECPGADAYALLPAIARRVAATGLPKLYAPTVAGVLGGPIRFQARLSSALPWTVTVADRSGAVVAAGRGRGTLVDWTWQSATGATPYTWTISAPGIRVATGRLGGGRPVPQPPPSLSAVALTPATVAPSSDGSGGSMTVAFTLRAAAQVAATVDDATGQPVEAVLGEARAAGPNTFAWNAGALPDGRYVLVLTASSGAKKATKRLPFVVDRTLTGLQALPTDLSPNGDGVNDTTTFSFVLAQSVPLQVVVESAGVVAATVFGGQLGPGPETLTWDGTGGGVPLADGSYTAVFTYTDALGQVQQTIPLTIDTRPPTLTLLDKATLRFSLDEPATVTALVDGTTRIVRLEPKGTFTLPFQGAVTSVTAQAQDLAGNESPVVTG